MTDYYACNDAPSTKSGKYSEHRYYSKTRIFLTLMLVVALVLSCQSPSTLDRERTRTLTPDERYIIDLYLKITEIEENLQDNPEARDEKYRELSDEFDEDKVRRIILELENDPERWLAVYKRINDLLKRRTGSPST